MRQNIKPVHEFIINHWNDTVRQPYNQAEDEVPLVAPFTVPTAGPTFRLLFYWDVYFTCEGLLRSGRADLARANADNFIHLIETLGFVPNYPLKHDLNRSQPPVASLLFRAVYEHERDKTWLARACQAAKREHAFWMSMRCFSNGLNHYGQHLPAARLLDEARDAQPGRIVHVPPDLAGRARHVVNNYAECESGWDFTPRFAGRCTDFAPVDLNCLLYALETNLAWFCTELDDPEQSYWETQAAARRELVNRYLWDETRGAYFDFNMASGQPGDVLSAAGFSALWHGLATLEQASRFIKHLPALERCFGLLACAPGLRPPKQVYQWDAPNVWAPLQFAAIAGLLRYGFINEALRIAEKYVRVVTLNFERTGNLWEKYNAETGSLDVANEYEMPAMLGWTAGTFLFAYDILEKA